LSNIPSNNEANLEHFAIPTDTDQVARNTNRAVIASKGKCECCNMASAKIAASGKKLHKVKCDDCKTAMNVCESCVEKDASCPHCESKKVDAVEEKEAQSLDALKSDAASLKGDVADLNAKSDDVEELTNTTRVTSIQNSRIKAAYSCATKLALAGIINSDECDSYADQLLEDGLRADVMIKNTQLLLRSAQASAERVAAAAAQKLNTRTASAMSISTSPALSGSASAALDIQSALKGTWTMPKIED
jgi:hypothetical protein